MLEVQELPDPLTVETHLCHVGRSHRRGGPGLSSPETSRLIIGHWRRAVQPCGSGTRPLGASHSGSIKRSEDWRPLPRLARVVPLGQARAFSQHRAESDKACAFWERPRNGISLERKKARVTLTASRGSEAAFPDRHGDSHGAGSDQEVTPCLKQRPALMLYLTYLAIP
jgi:hypothetical protein